MKMLKKAESGNPSIDPLSVPAGAYRTTPWPLAHSGKLVAMAGDVVAV